MSHRWGAQRLGLVPSCLPIAQPGNYIAQQGNCLLPITAKFLPLFSSRSGDKSCDGMCPWFKSQVQAEKNNASYILQAGLLNDTHVVWSGAASMKGLYISCTCFGSTSYQYLPTSANRLQRILEK